MGSGGGSSDVTLGGAGGGAVSIFSQYITINGRISVNGNNGITPGGGRGGGGGSGGGILIVGDEVGITASAVLSANGGNGSVGTSPANDDGGGGGGGRIKTFYQSLLTLDGTLAVNFGVGGPNGGTPGQPGSVGTTFNSTIVFPTVYLLLSGSEEAANYGGDALIAALNTDYCIDGSPISLSATPAGGVFSGSGISGNQLTPSVAGPGDVTINYNYTDSKGCVFADAASVTIHDLPSATASTGGAICTGSDLSLTAGGGISYSWTGPDNFASSDQNPAITNATTNASGTYTVTVTDVFGCSATATTTASILDCSGIEEETAVELMVFPNPSADFITLNSNIDLTGKAYFIMDYSGRLVLSGIFTSNNQPIEVLGLHAGMYIIRLETATISFVKY